MAFWSKKKLSEILIKSFKNDNITYKLEGNVLSFEFPISNIMLYPYIKIDDDSEEYSIVINIKKEENVNFNNLNDFNINSRYFKAMYDNGIIYLSYVFASDENIKQELNRILGSLNPLIDKIQNL